MDNISNALLGFMEVIFMSNRMPEKIWAEDDLRWNVGNTNADGEIVDDMVEYTRTDTIPKITVVRYNPKGYWEMLSDGSKLFMGYYESIEEEYMAAHPDHDGMVPEAWKIVPSGQWQAIIDLSIEEATEELKEAGYQVFVIPSRAQVAREFYQTAFNRFHHIQSENANFEEALVEVLKEWEEADGK
jgi:hypothetical protein